jgi:hypothetical protein
MIKVSDLMSRFFQNLAENKLPKGEYNLSASREMNKLTMFISPSGW